MTRLAKTLLPLLILLLSVGIYLWLASLKKTLPRRPIIPSVPIVQVQYISKNKHQTTILCYGTIQPYDQITITPQVSGRVTYVNPHFRIGERIKKGEKIIGIEDIDLQASLAQAESTLAQSQLALEEEKIQAKQALNEWKSLGKSPSSASDYLLRKPQLAFAHAQLQAAQQAVLLAKEQVKRCNILAPYDAIVLQRNVSLGDIASLQSSLGSIVATSKSEARLSLSGQELSKIQTKAKTITVYRPDTPQMTWEAQLVRQEPSVNTDNQVYYLIAEINHPYAGKHPLPLGSFVCAKIPSMPLKDCYAVEESALIEDAYIWVLDDKSLLTKLPIEHLMSKGNTAYIRLAPNHTYGLKDPLHLIPFPLTTFEEGALCRPEKRTKAHTNKKPSI